MSKNLVVLAEDHDCRGLDGCTPCQTLFFQKSRRKWNSLLDRMRAVREHSRHIDNRIVGAIMNTREDK